MNCNMALSGQKMTINLANLRLYGDYPLVCKRMFESCKKRGLRDTDMVHVLEKAYMHMPWVILDEFEKMLNEPKDARPGWVEDGVQRKCRSPPMNEYMDGR